jgi:DNA-directed RNA polymerase subunit F
MNQHRNLTPEQQQQALQHESGFSQLPQQTQDRMRNRLAQLNAMDPQRRERILTYNERMEHLSVGERTEVRNSLSQLGSLPPEQRRQVAESFRQLRALPPEQRGAALNSPQYQYMNPSQRSALNNLLHVEPLLPPSEQPPR